jgi:hypothetical protein
LHERVDNGPLRGRAARLSLSLPKRHGREDELLLRAVVQIALEAPPSLVRCGHDSRPGRLDLGAVIVSAPRRARRGHDVTAPSVRA